SYYQTIHAYPSGGGSWIVASENLGIKAGLYAAAALLIDYILVSAVSLTAGVEAIASAFPILLPYRVEIALLILAILLVINLRGTSEAGAVISVPVYIFLFTYIPMLAYGVLKALRDGPGELALVAPQALQPLTLALLVHTFSSGCAALTGVEAISNAVPAFKEPKSKNASNVLLVMSAILSVLFLASIGLTQYFAVIPRAEETVLSALARHILGDGPLYVLSQFATLLILSVAANTAFIDFPRVVALLANESYVPRQLSNLGDRLVFANGVYLLSAITAALIILFKGNSHALIPLFTVGAFFAFTLSQFGMVVHWRRIRGAGWRLKSFVNGLGGLATLTALLIIASSKFFDGAWITIIIIPLAVSLFLRVCNYYKGFDAQISSWDIIENLKENRYIERSVVPVSHINQGTIDAVHLATKASKKAIGVHVIFTENKRDEVIDEWNKRFPRVPLHIIHSPYRSVSKSLVNFLEDLDKKSGGEPTTVILPTFVTNRWWQMLLHNQTNWWIRTSIRESNRKNGVDRKIIEVPYMLREIDFKKFQMKTEKA
ncbi:APC family permease, partial [Candidatus Bathyarchaeota archaeon]|nr:APC family permease [Candidatus Bathyarchaeota archaeon]